MKKCPKCNYTRRPEDTAPDYECPACGVVYAKVAGAEIPEAWRDSRPDPVALAATSVSRENDIDRFADLMRSDTLYPTFRQLVGLFYILWLVLAALVFIGSVAGFVMNSGAARFGILLSGVIFAVVLWVVARVTREMALMLADLSDAAVRIASKAK